MAYYGGEEQRQKDERKKKIDSFMDKAMPKRTFDMFGRETNRRTGKLLNTEEQFNALFDDPLAELWELAEGVLDKPILQDPEPSSVRGPDQGNYEHPVTQQKKQVNSMIAQGTDPLTAHQTVHGEVDSADVESKAKLASTLGRLQDDKAKTGVKAEPGSTSIYATDAKIEKMQDQVTHNDLRTPMNQEVPDREQTPRDQVAEEAEIDYNEDVAFLQKYGRA